MNENPLPILLIDDHVENLIAIEKDLRGENVDVITASSGAEGLVRVAERDFAVIFLDTRMPMMSGFETAALIRSRGINTPIVFLSGSPAKDTPAARALPGHAYDFLATPVDTNLLRLKVAFFTEVLRRNRELEKQSAQARASADSKYWDLVEGIRNGFVWAGTIGEYRMSFISSSAFEISGFPGSRWLGEKMFYLAQTHEDDREVMATAVSQMLRTHEDIEFEHRLIREDGSVVWLHSTVWLSGVDKSEYRGLSVDITRLKETEQSLRDAIEARDDFLSVASHELKTPITPLKLQNEGFKRLLLRGELCDLPEATLMRMLETSDQQIGVLARLVDQLLDVSQIKAGKFELRRVPTDLVALVKRVVQLYQNSLSSRRVSVDLRMPAHFIGQWDESRLEQVLVNLIDNALKYGEGKPIAISLNHDQGRASLSVIDQGIGIEATAHQRIFARFERAVSPANYAGLGLGLFICQQIIDLHQGSIEVHSRPGEGAAFTLHLPL